MILRSAMLQSTQQPFDRGLHVKHPHVIIGLQARVIRVNYGMSQCEGVWVHFHGRAIVLPPVSVLALALASALAKC